MAFITTYLVQKTIGTVGHDANHALLALKARRQRDLGLAEVAEAALLDNGEDLLPVGLGGAVEGDAEQPVGLRVGAAHGQRVAADVEVDELAGAGGQVGGEAAAGGRALVVVAEADGLGVVHEEMGLREGGQGEDGGDDGRGTHGDGCGWGLVGGGQEARVDLG